MNKGVIILVYGCLLIILIGSWQYFGDRHDNVLLLISKPSNVLAYWRENMGLLAQSALVTLTEALGGLLLALLLSFGTAIACFVFPRLLAFVLPLMIVNQVVPLITLAPLFIMLFGDGMTGKVAMAALLCYFPVFVNTMNGYRLIPQNIHDLLFIYQAGLRQRIFKVYFPLSLPGIMTGLKIAGTLSVIGAIVAEFNGAETGLGKNLFLAAKKLEPELMICSLLLAALAGGAIYLIIYWTEKRFGKWYNSEN